MTTLTRLKSLALIALVAVALVFASVPPASEASSATGDQIVRSARAQLGTPYAWGGNGPNSFDCSGLVRHVFAQHGITSIPRSSIDQQRWARSISRSQLQRGDLVFQSWTTRNGRNGTDHVGIYIGDGRIVDSSPSLGGVIERTINESVVTGYGRVPGVTQTSSPSATSSSSWAGGTTRAEAARIVADVKGLPNRSNPFGVTTQGGAVGAVYHAGIALPYSDGTWRPNVAITPGQLGAWLDRADVTRAQAARIVADVKGLPNRSNPFGVTTQGGAVGAVYHADIALPYSDGTWRPNAKITSGQVSAWMSRAA